MAKTIENTKINNLPTSQLILYMKSPELHDEALKNEIDRTVFNRLTTEYRLQPSVARDFVDREHKIIDDRGYNVGYYAFGIDIPFKELIHIFYNNTELPISPNNIGKSFKNLTMSELVLFYLWFDFYEHLFEERNLMFNKFIAKIERSQRKVLNRQLSFMHTIYEKESDINSLQDYIYSFQKRQTDERILIDYNDLYKGYMFDEALRRINENSYERLISPLFRESYLVPQGPKSEVSEYHNLDFDAYHDYISIPRGYGITDFNMARKRRL